MAQVVGIGGIFMKSRDRAALALWYRRVLGLEIEAAHATAMFQPGEMAVTAGAIQLLSFFAGDTDYIEPSKRDFMVNLCVDDLDGMLARCAAEGVVPVWRDDNDPNGRFAHLIDPEGLKIELWQPAG